ncbi:MAG: DEAD/DEAH box helicase [Bacteriovoracaceae bacterium]|nr:DEAD/DEAH box helicase [Bacteriovoracaceae bacterium]
MNNSLGQWAVIDIETTGIDASKDGIIDVGFLQFEGTKLVRQYSSLVRSEYKLSQFIQKLTGIKSKNLKKAPVWEDVETEVQDLYGHSLIAHNAEFERSFLQNTFDKIDDGEERETYEDSLFFLSLLFAGKSSLNLESFIIQFDLAAHEAHRGLQDSLDLLKVMLVGTLQSKNDPEFEQTLSGLFTKYNLDDWWFTSFYRLSISELLEIASEIDFDVEDVMKELSEREAELQTEEIDGLEKSFELKFSGENIKNIFRDEEKIKEKFSGYRFRESQEELSLKVGQAFKNNVHAMVQAPTGTGKTLGYLIPAALFSREEKKQVLVATGTKALQHQAMSKDVPQLRKLLGLDDKELNIKQLIGSNNHYCELLFRNETEEEDLFSSSREFEERFSDLYFDMLFYHNSKAKSDKLVTRGDIPYVFKMKMNEFRKKDQAFAVDYRSCTGSNCPFKGECSYLRGLREAREADIIIGNHALMFSWPRGFPRPEHVVVDEAHKIEGETTRAFTYEVSEEGLESLNKSLLNMQGLGSLFYLLAQHEVNEGESTEIINQLREKTLMTQRMLQDHLLLIPDKVELFFKKRPRYTDKYWNESPMLDRKSVHDQTEKSIRDHLESIFHILGSFYNDLLPYGSRFEAKEMQDDHQAMAWTRFEKFLGGIEDIVTALEIGLQGKEEYARSMKFHEKHGFIMESAPINVGKVLHDGLLATSASVLYTSATLGNANGDQGTKGIEWATGYLYLEAERRFKQGFYLPAAYDYKKNTRVYLCDDTPSLYDRTFVENVMAPTMDLIEDLGGRSLLLFSARVRFEKACEVLLNRFEGKIPVFIQGMGNNVVEDFKESGEGILVGMESFGEGIDIPGDALQFVFIDKIPDLRQDYVIQRRRDYYEANLGNEFNDYYLSGRTRALHQKLGRLLRTEKDFGGVIIVDSRVKKWKGRTLEKLVKQMEPYQLERANLADACTGVREFIETNSLPGH